MDGRITLRMLFVLTLTLAAATSAPAALVVDSAEWRIGTFPAATGDLVNQGTPSFSSQSNTGGSLFSSDPLGTGLNNGTVYADGNAGSTENDRCYCPAAGSSITFDLDLTAQPAGYTIGSISSISGGSQNRRSQRFRIETSVVGDPGFTTVIDENAVHVASNASNGEMRVQIHDDTGAPLASGVDQVRVTYFQPTGVTYGDSMYRELDIYSYDPVGHKIPTTGSAGLTAHFNADDPNGDGGHSKPAGGTDVGTWTNLVDGRTQNHNLPTDGQPTFIAAGGGGIGNQPTLRFEATGAGGDLMFDNGQNLTAQTIFAVVTMEDNGASLATLLSNASHGLNLRQTTSASPAYFGGNSGDFLIQQSTAANGGTITINGNRRLDIPGGFGAAHVVKAERNTPAAYTGFRFSDNVVADRRWNGDVAEVLVFDSKLSGDDTLRVEKYITGKYGIAYNTALDERITESKQIALDPFEDGTNLHAAVNFHYGGPTTAGTYQGIGFDNVDLTGGTPPTGPFPLTANAATAGATLSLDFTFGSDNGQRTQNSLITGPDADTLNTVANEFFYIGGNHTNAQMTFDGLAAKRDVFVQVLGGDSNWISTVQVLANGQQAVDWMGVAENGSSTNTASLLGFYSTTDSQGRLQLDFSIASGNYAGIGGVIVTQAAEVPEPASMTLLALALAGTGAYVRRRRRA